MVKGTLFFITVSTLYIEVLYNRVIEYCVLINVKLATDIKCTHKHLDLESWELG